MRSDLASVLPLLIIGHVVVGLPALLASLGQGWALWTNQVLLGIVGCCSLQTLLCLAVALLPMRSLRGALPSLALTVTLSVVVFALHGVAQFLALWVLIRGHG